MSGLFFGGRLDHLIFIAIKSPTSHYGLRLGTAGQLAFAKLDFRLAHDLPVTDGDARAGHGQRVTLLIASFLPARNAVGPR